MSTDPLLLSSKLDAVNTMLASVGQSPVNTLSVTGIADVSIAELALDNTTREVLTRGWSFNTDTDWPLIPDVNKNIIIPAATLYVDPVDPLRNYVQRINAGVMMLYNKDKRTFDFDDTVKVDITHAFKFDEIPQVARTFIATRATRIFQAQVVGSDILFRFTDLHEREALAALQRLEDATEDNNILNSATESNLNIFHRRTNVTR